MKHLLLSGLAFATLSLAYGQDPLYSENFDGYASGVAITEVSQAFDLWPAAGATDAFVTSEAQLSGTNSLKIEGQLTGGPMDVVLTAGLEGIQDVTFNVLVPPGSSGYYNVQENIVAGTEWAFECYLGSDGTITFAVDPAADGSGGPEFTTTYNYGAWIEIKHEIDTDADLMNILIDGECVGELPYDGEQIGGVNFYAAGDGATLPLYYLDDISVTTLETLPQRECGEDTDIVTEMHMEMVFGPNPAKDNLRIQANFEQATVRILALNGQVVFEEVRSDLRGGSQLELNLDNGIYLLEVSHDLERSTQRLVIQK
jgi:hypothetical protein